MNPIQNIPIEQIDLVDDIFSINYLPDLRRLRASIEEIGLIQPVLLRRKPTGYQIVCGFRRVAIMKELGRAEIESRVFEEKERDDFSLFTLSLYENLTSRGFNLVEKAMTLEKLIHLFQIEPMVVIERFLPLLSLEPHEKILKTFLSLARMEDEIKTYVLREEVSRSNIRRIAGFSSGDQMAILSLISPLKLGENRLREILILLEEISRIDQCPIEEIVARPEMKAILSEKEMTPPQKADRVKKLLMALRYPRMKQREEKFREGIKKLNLPANLFLIHQPFFEGKGMKVEFQFESKEEYQTLIRSLLDLEKKKEFEEMMESL